MNFLQLFAQHPVVALVFLLAVVSAVTIHEFAHAWTAVRLGDETPRLQGRISLNPAAHIDPIGGLAFLLVGFGWGKPVLYNPLRLSRRIDELFIALAGPISNILFAIFLNALAFATATAAPVFSDFLELASQVSIILAAFNLIPIPPLDGSSIVSYFWPEYRSLVSGQIGLIILLLLIFSGSLGIIMQPLLSLFSQIGHLFGLI